MDQTNETKKVLVCDWYGHIYPYDVKTKGKYPVHLIDGGAYMTEDTRNFGDADMGWFNLNTRDYQWFKDHLVEMDYEKLI